MNKILPHVIWIYFVLILFKFTFLEFWLYKKIKRSITILSPTFFLIQLTQTHPLHTQSGSANSTQLRLLKLRPVACSSSWTLLKTPPAVVTGHSDSSVVTLVLTVWVTVGSVCPGGLPPVITFDQWSTGPLVHACTWVTSTAERSSHRLVLLVPPPICN